MSQIYLNGPSVGRSMSAEEFAAGAGHRPGSQSGLAPAPSCGCGNTAAPMPPIGCGCGCGCGGNSPDCPDDGCSQVQPCCCQQMICCCHPAPCPAPRPPHVDEECCCKQSFRAALGLLCDQQLSSLLDFDASAFLTNTYSAGTVLTCGKHSGQNPCAEAEVETERKPHPPCPPCSGGASDNLGTLSGSFRRFAPCTCDLLDIDAKLHILGQKDCDFTATQVSLCELDAVVIQGAKACAEGDLTADEVTARNFRCLRQRLSQRLNPCGNPCGESCCSCASDGRECCCAAGLLATLAQNNLSRRVSLAAGLLLLRNVTLLGTVGSVLVLANDTDNRLYFVCVNSVQFVG